MFKIKLEKPEPDTVKISKKNVCIVTISPNEEGSNEQDEHQKMVEYFV